MLATTSEGIVALLTSAAQDSLLTAPSPLAQTIGRGVQVIGLELDAVELRLLEALVILAMAWVILRLSRVLVRRMERRLLVTGSDTVDEHAQRSQTLMQLANSVVTGVVLTAAALTVLNIFIPIGPLLAGVGVLGLAVSFGAQSLVKDLISGFFILLENQFTVGDIVEINGKSGVVERMTLRVVMLRDVEGTLHIMPNGSIDVVSNKTQGWSRAVIDIGVAYKERVDEVIRVMKETLQDLWNDSHWRGRLMKSPEVWGVEGLADSAVQIRVVAETRPGKQWEIKREIRRRLKNRFDQEGIEIPFPQRTLHFPRDQTEQDLSSAP